jgi:Ni,Fe-hydrogenase III large subunit
MTEVEKSASQSSAHGEVLPFKHFTTTQNACAIPLAHLTPNSIGLFRQAVVRAIKRGARLVALTLLPKRTGQELLLAVLADDELGQLGLIAAELPKDRSYPSLTQEAPSAQAFERELYEQHGIEPLDHPWLKPVRRHDDLEARAANKATDARPHPFFRVEGDGIHEVAVGPVHAGVIEPGHFRFQCHGERVLSLEIQLGYQHRGAQALMLSGSPARRLAVAETLAGDTAIGHGLAYCQAIEGLGNAEPTLAALALRGIALELERCANHVGDLGALCNDVGFLPSASWFGRLRGEYLNLTLELCGNRFGHGLLTPGGVRFGLSEAQRQDCVARLKKAETDLADIAALMFDAPGIGSRFEGTGTVPHALAQEIGLVGPAGRASGCDRDVRRDHPSGLYRFSHIPVALFESGDVMARALVRWYEAERSTHFAIEQIEQLSTGALALAVSPPQQSSLIVSMVEGWRGEIVHLAATDSDGQLACYHAVDPSFHNWFGLAMALRDNQISDFPLCNKSFNLSYAGHDL